MATAGSSAKRKLTDYLVVTPNSLPSSPSATGTSSSASLSTSAQQQQAAGSMTPGRPSRKPRIESPFLDEGADMISSVAQRFPKKDRDRAKSPNLGPSVVKIEHKTPNFETQVPSTGFPPRYHQPKVPASEDQVVIRKFYPAEMSNERAEMYKSGKLLRPIDELETALSGTAPVRAKVKVKDAVVHWFRGDIRVFDNAALSIAGEKAAAEGVPLLTFFLISPEDYEAHIKSPARVDFLLRSLEVLQAELDKLDIPLYTAVVKRRNDMQKTVLSLLDEWNASHLFANMEYEVDELRRDAKIVLAGIKKKTNFQLVHDSVCAPPGAQVTKSTGKPFTVFTPWFKSWCGYLQDNPEYLVTFPRPAKNPDTARQRYPTLFNCPIPPCPEGKRLDPGELEYVRALWPAGELEALARLDRFLDHKIKDYKDARDYPGLHGTSRLSTHFTAGTLSSRTAVNKAKQSNGGKLMGGNPGAAHWISEVGWRDFYRGILVNFPWICMSKPFKLEYSLIPWEYNDAHFLAWTRGLTGYPIVDAAMRHLVKDKFIPNRCRMIVASFLTKDLCLDWRRGEKFFMEHLVDGDFASNNGGWGWSSSSGCDPQPYFRVFNPLLQSEKFDPDGEYIRKWVPELRSVTGKAIHAPWERLGREEQLQLKKTGYPKPIVKHAEAKDRAVDMFKRGLGREKP